MSKLKIRVRLQGLELDIEGERTDIPNVASGLGQQLSGLLTPALSLAAQEEIKQPYRTSLQDAEPEARPKRKKKASSTVAKSDALVIDWKHDATVYGVPRIDWTVGQKAMWLLFVLSQVTDSKELSANDIKHNFNKHFRQAKAIDSSNIARALGRAKLANPSTVGEDTSTNPSRWYLTEPGIAEIKALIQSSLTSN